MEACVETVCSLRGRLLACKQERLSSALLLTELLTDLRSHPADGCF